MFQCRLSRASSSIDDKGPEARGTVGRQSEMAMDLMINRDIAGDRGRALQLVHHSAQCGFDLFSESERFKQVDT